MWLKTKDGTLVNLAHVSHVHIQAAAGIVDPAETVAIAHINSGVQGAVCVIFEGPKERVKAKVDELFRGLCKESRANTPE